MPKIQFIACHYANRSGRGEAACFLPLETVEDLVMTGQAIWNKRRTYVNFTKTQAQITPTQPSCKMGPDVMFGCACGDLKNLALRDAWMPKAA